MSPVELVVYGPVPGKGLGPVGWLLKHLNLGPNLKRKCEMPWKTSSVQAFPEVESKAPAGSTELFHPELEQHSTRAFKRTPAFQFNPSHNIFFKLVLRSVIKLSSM